MGKLNQLSVPLVFKKIMNKGFSGELFLKGDKVSKNLFFKNGNLIFAKSDLCADQLGEMLLVLGKINEDQYNHISGLAHSGDNIVCEILIQSHFITEEDLMFARLHQVRKIAISSFQMKLLHLEKTEKLPEIYTKDLSIPLSSVIIEGVRTMQDLSLFKNKIQHFAPSPSYIPDPIKSILSDKQVQLYDNLHKCKGMSNYEIIAALTLEPMGYWKDMFIFLLLELIEFKKHICEYDMDQDVQDLISLKKKLLKRGIDYYQLLSIDKNSELDEINIHFKQLFQKFDVNNFKSAISPEIIKISQSVSSKLKQIQQEMIHQNEKNRKKTEEHMNININMDQDDLELVIENNEIEKIEDKIKTIDLTDEYRLEPDIPVIENRIETIDLTDEYRLEPEIQVINNKIETIDLTDEHRLEPEIPVIDDRIETIDLTDVHRLEPDIPINNDRIETIDLTDEHRIEPEMLKQEDRKPTITLSKQDETLLQAQEQYDMGLYQNVINILRNASKKTDMKGEIYYLLGLAQSHFRDSYFEAEMSLKKAVELNPWSSGPTYALGNLYKKQGKKKLAQMCFERVMSMTANHGEAVKAVQLLMKKKNKQSFHFFST